MGKIRVARYRDAYSGYQDSIEQQINELFEKRPNIKLIDIKLVTVHDHLNALVIFEEPEKVRQ